MQLGQLITVRLEGRTHSGRLRVSNGVVLVESPYGSRSTRVGDMGANTRDLAEMMLKQLVWSGTSQAA